jgi:hypothetical protein
MEDDKPRVNHFYSRILQQLKDENGHTHKLCYLKKNNKVEPVIIKIKNDSDFALNQNSLTHRPSSVKPFRIIEPISIKKPLITDHDRALDEELRQFKKEIEDKFHNSATNTNYRYPLSRENRRLMNEGHIENVDILSTMLIRYRALHHILSQRKHTAHRKYTRCQ